ncbi:MAG: hypothetical protein R8G34_22430 [Paracoccaceae bacterium]|nr:hypothetical protein [Paracoccaceae bacterium]
MEDGVGDIIKTLQPEQTCMRLTRDMFRYIWEAHPNQAKAVIRESKRQIAQIDKEIDKLLDLIMAAGKATVIRRYEAKIEQHDHDKARLAENLTKQTEPRGTYEKNKSPLWRFSQALGESGKHRGLSRFFYAVGAKTRPERPHPILPKRGR